MLDLEKILRGMISAKFKDLRGSISPDIISNGQRTAIYNIEKGKNPKSGNFVTDTLLKDYSSYFGMDKSELIFGDAHLSETHQEKSVQAITEFINHIGFAQ